MKDKVLELSDRFALAAIDDKEWLPALKAMAEATGSARGQVIGIVPGAVPFNWINDLDEDAIARFTEHERGDPDINVRVRASLADETFVIRSETDYDFVGRGTGFDLYREMCDSYDIPFGCQTKVLEGPGYFVGLALNRTRKDGKTDADTRALFAAIAPHVRQAMKMQLALEGRGPILLDGVMDYVRLPIFVCDHTGIVLEMTSEAEMLLSRGYFRIVERRLGTFDPDDSALLLKGFNRVHRQEQLSETVLLHGGEKRQPVIVDICKLPAAARCLSLFSRTLIIVRSGRRWHEAAPAILREAFKLSPAEADIALGLARGRSRDEIAAARNTSVHTVKVQLKSIFSKLGVAREGDLVAMLGDMFRA